MKKTKVVGWGSILPLPFFNPISNQNEANQNRLSRMFAQIREILQWPFDPSTKRVSLTLKEQIYLSQVQSHFHYNYINFAIKNQTLAMTERIFAFVLLFSLVSPLTFEHRQSSNELFEQAASFAKYLKPYSGQICLAGLNQIGTSIGVKNNLKNLSQKIIFFGQYSQAGEQKQLGGQQIPAKMSFLGLFANAQTGDASGCMIFKMLPSQAYFAIQFKDSSYAHVCVRAKINPRTCFKNIKANSNDCLRFTNSEYSSKQGILVKPGYAVSVNANYEENNGCKVQQISVVLK